LTVTGALLAFGRRAPVWAVRFGRLELVEGVSMGRTWLSSADSGPDAAVAGFDNASSNGDSAAWSEARPDPCLTFAVSGDANAVAVAVLDQGELDGVAGGSGEMNEDMAAGACENAGARRLVRASVARRRDARRPRRRLPPWRAPRAARRTGRGDAFPAASYCRAVVCGGRCRGPGGWVRSAIAGVETAVGAMSASMSQRRIRRKLAGQRISEMIDVVFGQRSVMSGDLSSVRAAAQHGPSAYWFGSSLGFLREAHHAVDVRPAQIRPRVKQRESYSEALAVELLDLLALRPATGVRDSVAYTDSAGPVLGVDDGDSAAPDHDVIDIAVAQELDAVQHHHAEAGELSLELSTDELLTSDSAFASDSS